MWQLNSDWKESPVVGISVLVVVMLVGVLVMMRRRLLDVPPELYSIFC